MGERLLLYRLADGDERAAVERAIANRKCAEQMRDELRRGALGVFAGLPARLEPGPASPAEGAWLIELVGFVARGRAARPPRRARHDDPGRGVDPPGAGARGAARRHEAARRRALRAVTNTALGCIPAGRRRVLEALAFPAPDSLYPTHGDGVAGLPHAACVGRGATQRSSRSSLFR